MPRTAARTRTRALQRGGGGVAPEAGTTNGHRAAVYARARLDRRMGAGASVTLTPLQSRIWGARQFACRPNDARFRVWIAGRRSGKTTLARVELLSHALEVRGALAWYVGPTVEMARELMFEPLVDTLDPQWVADIQVQRMMITLRNGSTIAVKSGEKPHRLVGRGLTRVVLDEFAQVDPLAWQKIVPALGDRRGDALLITTPEGIASWAFDLYQRGLKRDCGGMWRAWRTSTAEAGTLSADDLAALAGAMDPRLYAQELAAEFAARLDRIIYAYDDRDAALGGHVTTDAEDVPGLPVLVGIDFNVSPMSAVLAVIHADRLRVFDCISLPSSSTEELCRAIRDKVGADRHVIACPDASGRHRTTAAAGLTDYVHLQRAGFVVDAPAVNPSLKDRFNATNAAFRTANGERHAFVHPRADALRQSLNGYQYRTGTSTPNDTEGWDHQCAALGYLVHRRFNRLQSAGFTVGAYT